MLVRITYRIKGKERTGVWWADTVETIKDYIAGRGGEILRIEEIH